MIKSEEKGERKRVHVNLWASERITLIETVELCVLAEDQKRVASSRTLEPANWLEQQSKLGPPLRAHMILECGQTVPERSAY